MKNFGVGSVNNSEETVSKLKKRQRIHEYVELLNNTQLYNSDEDD